MYQNPVWIFYLEKSAVKKNKEAKGKMWNPI